MSVSQMNMTFLDVTECLCHRWTWIYSVWHNQIQSFPCSWVIIEYDIIRFVAEVTRLVSLIEHNFLIFWSSWIHPPIFRWVHDAEVFCEVFSRTLLVFRIWLFVIILCVHRFMTANYPRYVYKLIVCKRIVWNFFIRKKQFNC